MGFKASAVERQSSGQGLPDLSQPNMHWKYHTFSLIFWI